MIKRTWILWALLIILAIVVALNLPEIERAVAAILNANPRWALVAGVLLAGRYVVDAYLFRLGFHVAGVESRLRDLVPVVYASLFANLLGVAASGALIVNDAARRGQPAARATAGFLLVLVADYAGFLLFLVAGVAYLASLGILAAYQIAGAALFLLYIVLPLGALLLGLAYPALLRRILSAVQRAAGRAARRMRRRPLLAEDWAERSTAGYLGAARAVASHPRQAAVLLAVALPFHGLELLGTLALFQALRLSLDPLGVNAGYAVGLLFWTIGITPQGIGVVESVMALTYISLGLPVAGAIAVALAFRGLSFWLPLLIGTAFAARIRSLRT